jgi:hypothetical protein
MKLDRLRVALAAAWLAAAAIFALVTLNELQPIGRWLVTRYAGLWAATLGWAVACLAAGLHLLRVFRLAPPLRERLVLATALGMFAFGLAVFVLGLVHALGAPTFFALPLLFLTFGWRDLRRAGAGIRKVRRLVRAPRPGVCVAAAMVFGLLAVVLLYLETLSPGNVSYDSRWYHLGLAQDYAASGAVRRFPEGSFQASVPQLATYLYTWAFLLPWGGLFSRVELAAHMEIATLLLTLAALPLAVTWLARGRRVRAAWAALFLFPGIFVYDGTLNGGADHILAAWTIPLALALGRFWRSGDRRWGALTAAFAAQAMTTKFQAMYVVFPAIALFVFRGVQLGLRAPEPAARREAWRALGVAGAVGLALAAPLWLKNWIWYGNPVFPFARERFATRPWSVDAAMSHDYLDPRWIPAGKGLAALADTARETLRFGFHAHDWPSFHGAWPVSGFLFTLLWPLPFVLPRAGGRQRVASVALLVGAGIWYYTFHQDRYLQILAPLMAATVLVTLNQLWHGGRLARVAAGALVGVQVAWAGGLLFLPTHAMLGRSAIANALDLLASGFTQTSRRLVVDGGLEAVSHALPPRSRVLLHGQHLRLGLDAPVVTDVPEQQSAFAYRAWGSPAEITRQLRAMGITHVVWTPAPVIWGNWGSELAFFDFVNHYLVDRQSVDGYLLGRLPAQLPAGRPDLGDDAVDLRFCRGRAQTTLMDLHAVITSPAPLHGGEPSAPTRFIVTEDACGGVPPSPPYTRVAGISGYTLWSRPIRR